MSNFRSLVLGLVLVSLAGVSWGEDEISTAAASGDADSIGVSANDDGTWFAFTNALGTRVIYFCSLQATESTDAKEPNCKKVVADSYNKQMEEFGKGSYK